jgi:hypothetical protein
MTFYFATVWLAYIAIMRRSSALKLSMFVMVLHPMNCTSLGTKSGLPAIYDSHYIVFLMSFLMSF